MRVEPTDFCVAKPQRTLPFGIHGNRRGMRRTEKRQNRQIQGLYLCLRLREGLVRMVVMVVGGDVRIGIAMLQFDLDCRLPSGRITRRDWLRISALSGLATSAVSRVMAGEAEKRPPGFGR